MGFSQFRVYVCVSGFALDPFSVRSTNPGLEQRVSIDQKQCVYRLVEVAEERRRILKSLWSFVESRIESVLLILVLKGEFGDRFKSVLPLFSPLSFSFFLPCSLPALTTVSRGH